MLRELHDPLGDAVERPLVHLAELTDLGELAVVAVAVALVLVWARRWRDLAYGGIVVVVVGAGNPLLKELVDRARPDVWVAPMSVSEHTFPSGHAANTAALAGALVMLSWPTRGRRAAVAGGVGLVAVVAFGQLALGLHYPSDVLAGWLWAAAWTAVVWSTRPDAAASRRAVRPRRRPSG